ncbi:MAG: ribulose-phosphate 3-epimerase [Thermodesulfobacteriota bacterium]|nr:ribulose-phosphate 3-epimerase [Thermodesulfobacteriota bacterium]
MPDMKIAPSILSADLSRLGEEIKVVEEGGADWLHIDVMDGHFAPIITIGPILVSTIRKITKLPLDVHLMVYNPDGFIGQFAEAGSDIIVVSAEACTHLHRTIHLIKEKGCKAGICLNPATPLSALDHVLSYIDMVTILMVNPGFKGQKFIPGLTAKIQQLRKSIDEKAHPIRIQADGGISLDNISQVAQAGADTFVTGTAVFSADNYKEVIHELRLRAQM